MPRVRLFNGKPLMVAGKVALNDNCCCGGGVCTCPRDCDEISGFTISGSALYDNPGFGIFEQCSYSETWTRINQATSFSAPHQFKFYTEQCDRATGGVLVYDDNRSVSPISTDCFSSGATPTHASLVLAASGPPNSGGWIAIVGAPGAQSFVLSFFAEGDNAASNCVADWNDETVNLNQCDLSSLISTRTVSNTCVDGFSGTWTINGSFEIF